MFVIKRLAAKAASVAMLVLLAACAESASTPVPVAALQPVQKA
jgi:hypothetical protein